MSENTKTTSNAPTLKKSFVKNTNSIGTSMQANLYSKTSTLAATSHSNLSTGNGASLLYACLTLATPQPS